MTFSLASFCTNYVSALSISRSLKVVIFGQKSKKIKIKTLKKKKERKCNTLVKWFSSNDFNLSKLRIHHFSQ